MLHSYLKATYVNVAKYRSQVLINLGGLVLGMTSCLLIMLYLVDEYGFDAWIPDADRVYRYENEYLRPDGESTLIRKAPLRARRDLMEYFPEIEQATRIIDHDGVLRTDGENYFDKVWFVDPEFPQVFGLPMLQGDAAAALAGRRTVLISASAAQKYFGNEPAVGQVLSLDDGGELRVAGVFADMPRRSHIHFDLITRYDEADPQYNFGYSESWGAIEGYTYVKLTDGVSGAELNARLADFLQSHAAEFTLVPGQAVSSVVAPRLLNVRDIHLDSGGLGNIETPGNRQTLITLSVIAVLVLLIACINYINLTSVRSLDRTKETFVRKASGAGKVQIALQLLVEPVAVSLFALVASLSLVELLLPLYGNLIGRELATDTLGNIVLWVELVVLAAFIGLANGVVPAFTLATLPARALKEGRVRGRRALHWLHAGLVTLQFSVAATLVLASLVIFLQQNFLEQRDLGFAPEHKLVMRNIDAPAVNGRRELLANELGALADVTGVTFSVATPGDTVGAGFSRAVFVPGYRDEGLALYPKAVAANFFEVYGVSLRGGRTFSDALTTDTFYWNSAPGSTATAVLNETALAAIGFRDVEEALGKTLTLGTTELEIVGVVADFHFQALRDALTPNLYIYSPAEAPTLTLAYAPNADRARVVQDVVAGWKRLMPDYPLTLESVEDNVRAQYAADGRQFVLVATFTCLAIVIACIGLYALAAYATQRRTREVGIRKVHGASSSDLARLFLMQFTRPVMLANLIALPCGLYLMRAYLEAYEYHVEPGAGLFALTALLTLGLAWCAVLVQIVKTTRAKPVLALRYE